MLVKFYAISPMNFFIEKQTIVKLYLREIGSEVGWVKSNPLCVSVSVSPHCIAHDSNVL